MNKNESKIVIKDFKDLKTVEPGSVYKQSHVFRLQEADTVKDISYDPQKPKLETIPHVHFMRTVDSNGKSTNNDSNSVCGHYHNIELSYKNGKIEGKCSLPLRNKFSDKQEVVNYEIRIGNKITIPDQHTHKVEYICTEEIQVRQINPEVMSYVSAELAKGRVNDPSLKDAVR